MHSLEEKLQHVNDEKSFSAFLTEMRKDCEWHERIVRRSRWLALPCGS